MKIISRISMVVAALALTTSVGCAKSKSGDTPTQHEVSSADVQGLAQETLLVMKFHHDN